MVSHMVYHIISKGCLVSLQGRHPFNMVSLFLCRKILWVSYGIAYGISYQRDAIIHMVYHIWSTISKGCRISQQRNIVGIVWYRIWYTAKESCKSGSFPERDLQLETSVASSPLCNAFVIVTSYGIAYGKPIIGLPYLYRSFSAKEPYNWWLICSAERYCGYRKVSHMVKHTKGLPYLCMSLLGHFPRKSHISGAYFAESAPRATERYDLSVLPHQRVSPSEKEPITIGLFCGK